MHVIRATWRGGMPAAAALAVLALLSWGPTACRSGAVPGAGDRGADVPAADSPSDGAEAASRDVREIPDYAGREFPSCVPGTPKGECSTDFTSEIVCNDGGTAFVPVACGADSVCQDPAVGCTACRPGNVKCQDDQTVVMCDQTGAGYQAAQTCDTATTGQVCTNGACARLCDLNAKLQSYIGCEYWGVDLDNAFVPGNGQGGYYDAKHQPWAIVVSNTSTTYPAKIDLYTSAGPVTVDRNGDPIPTDALAPQQLRVFILPNDLLAENTVLKPLAYRVVSSVPISAYQFNPLSNVGVFSNDASLLLPSNALGRYYFVMSREETFEELKGFLTVVGVDPDPAGTQVSVTVAAHTQAGTDAAGNVVAAMNPGDTRNFVLMQFDTLNLETDVVGGDLTGSIVSASHPVAVFGGSQAANVPNTNHCCPGGQCVKSGDWLTCQGRSDCLCEWPHLNMTPPKDVSCQTNDDCVDYVTCCADHLEKQMFPVTTWGMEYVVAHTYPRGGEMDDYRFLAAEDGTLLTTYPTQVSPPVLDKGEWIDFEAMEGFEIHAKKPILVGHYIEAQDAPDPNVDGVPGPDDASTGDPDFLTAVPVEQFRTDYVFLTPDKYAFNAVTIIVPVGTDVTLDGHVLAQADLTFRPAKDILVDVKAQGLSDASQLGSFGDYNVIGDPSGVGVWAAWRVVVAPGVHVATAANPFGVEVYGYDRYVSYGYPAGLNLGDLKLVTVPGQ